MRLASPNLLIGLLIVLAVPMVGFWSASQRAASIDAWMTERFERDAATACGPGRFGIAAMVSSRCAAYTTAVHVRRGSLVVGLAGLTLVLGVALLAAWAGTDRERNARTFPRLIPPAMVLIGLLTVSQVAILVAVLHAWGVGGRWLAGLAFGGLVGAGVLVAALRTLLRRSPYFELAVAVPQRHGSAIATLVRSVAAAVGARPPTNVIVGLHPNFYVTSAPVALPTSTPTPGSTLHLTGETLYLSLPLLKLFSEGEVRAVIGHELGHFIGQDAIYSQRFAPAYHALLTGLDDLEAWGDTLLFRIAQLPAATLTNYLLAQFAVNERRIGRQREFEADRVGAAAASNGALAAALVKIGLVNELWPQLEAAVDPAPGRRQGPSLSDRVVALVRSMNPDALRGTANLSVRTSVPHPTDTHPETAERLRALGVKPADIDFSFAGAWGEEADAAEELGRLEREVEAVERMLARLAT